MNQFKNLIVWQKSITLAGKVYKLTDKLPSKERFELISQMNRSVVSIPSNIAEGAGRDSENEYCYHLSVSLGSAFELETQILICKELNYLQVKETEEVNGLINEIQKMLFAIHRKHKPSDNKKKKIENLKKSLRRMQGCPIRIWSPYLKPRA